MERYKDINAQLSTSQKVVYALVDDSQGNKRLAPFIREDVVCELHEECSAFRHCEDCPLYDPDDGRTCYEVFAMDPDANLERMREA